MSIQVANSNLFTNATITNSWNQGYKLEVDITSETTEEDWELTFAVPYNIRGAYGGIDLVDNEDGTYTISGNNARRRDLDPGETARAIFIIDHFGEGDDIIPEFSVSPSDIDASPLSSDATAVTSSLQAEDILSEAAVSSSPSEPASSPTDIITPDVDTSADLPTEQADSPVSTTSRITNDWNGGYRLEVDISSESGASDWTLDFDFPYEIRGAFGVDLTDNGNGTYSISGINNGQDLSAGESTRAVFIIDDGGNEATAPTFGGSSSTAAPVATASPAADSPVSSPTTSSPTVTAPIPEVEAPLALAASPLASGQDQDLSDRTLSSSAITVGFERHDVGTRYTQAVQRLDWDNVRFSTNGMNELSQISDRFSRSGNQSLRITYPAEQSSGRNAAWIVPEEREYYISYWVRFDDNFDFDGDRFSGGKLPGLGSGDLCSGGQTCDGTNGFTSRPHWRENGRAVLYLYHQDKPGRFGEDIQLTGADGEDIFYERGRWTNITQRVRINDQGQRNGSVDVYYDGEHVLSRDGLRFASDGSGIDTAYFSTFHGGSGPGWTPGQDTNAYFDDFIVSTNAADVGL